MSEYSQGAIKRAAFTVTSSGPGTEVNAVPLVAGKKIRILAMAYAATGSNDIRFRDGAAGAVIYGPSSVGAQGHSFGYNPNGWFETSAGNAFVVEGFTDSNVIGGSVMYVEI